MKEVPGMREVPPICLQITYQPGEFNLAFRLQPNMFLWLLNVMIISGDNMRKFELETVELGQINDAKYNEFLGCIEKLVKMPAVQSKIKDISITRS